jgi:hypothetical protein
MPHAWPDITWAQHVRAHPVRASVQREHFPGPRPLLLQGTRPPASPPD